MYTGKTLFAQLMDFLPWTTFTRIVDRYGGNRRVRTLPCTEHFRVLAFAQLTYRESLRDIEACLSAQSAKLYHMGIRSPIRRSTLADANEGRDWRIYAEFAQRLIAQARKLYAEEYSFDIVMGLDGEFHQENLRKRTRPWGVRAKNFETKTFGKLDKAANIFIEQANKLSPLNKT